MADRVQEPAGAELVERYLTGLQAERNLSVYTLRNYRIDLYSLLSVLQEEQQDPLSLTRQRFREYLGRLSAEAVARGSVTRRVSTIHAFYRYLAREGLLERDPLEGVRPPRRERRLPRFIKQEQLSPLLQAPSGDEPMVLRDRAILELLYATGVRISELTGLNLEDVEQDDWRLRVTGKGNKQRVVLYGKAAAEALERYVRHGRPHLLRGAQSALLLNRNGQRLSVRAVQLLVQKYAAAAGIDQRVFPHLFRHSFATHMLDGGADLRVVQELLGHESAGTTQIYTHVTEERQRQVYTEAFYKQWRPRSEREAARAQRAAEQAAAPPGEEQ